MLKHALRSLLRSPAFTLTAAGTLGVGIAAVTTAFSVVHAVLLAPLPYREPDRLVVARLSLPDYEDVREMCRSFEDTAVWASNLYSLEAGDESRQVLGGVISPSLLPLLGVEPALGRNFTPDDDGARTVILGYGLWQSVFAADPGAVGRVLHLSGTAYTVIGVAPPGFRFPSGDFGLWTPLGLLARDARTQAENRAVRIFTLVGRLAPGVTLQQAAQELEAISGRLATLHPATNAGTVTRVELLRDRLLGPVRAPLLVLLATVGLLLLIACANVANLLLARTGMRGREMAVRAALGAGRLRLYAQLATESLLLGLVGGALGLLLAMWGIDLLPAALEGRVPRAEAIRINAAVLFAALGASLATGVLAGVAPALQLGTESAALQEGGGRVAGGSRHARLRRAIVIAEIALSVVVVVGAILLVRSFATLASRPLGFEPAGALSFMVQFVKLPDPEARAAAAAAVVERLSGLPGVSAAGGATGLPAVTAQRSTRLAIDGRDLTPAEAGAYFIAATPAYFRAAGTPVLAGRAFLPTDGNGTQPVAVVSRSLASVLFRGEDPIGRRLRLLNPEGGGDWRTVVGVVADVRYQGLEAEAQPAVYTPFAQTPFPWLYMTVRSTGDPSALARSIRTVVRGVDPSLTAAGVRPMTDVVAGTLAEPRFNMLLVSGFAAVALILASVGIYGVIAYSVSQRTHEIGLRMALGAGRADVLALVFREGLIVTSAGVALGLASAALLTRSMAALLTGVAATDPVSFAGSALVLAAVALAASCLPARRAMRVEPAVALRRP